MKMIVGMLAAQASAPSKGHTVWMVLGQQRAICKPFLASTCAMVEIILAFTSR